MKAPLDRPGGQACLAGVFFPVACAGAALVFLSWMARRGAAALCGGHACDAAGMLQYAVLIGPGAFCIFLAAYGAYPALGKLFVVAQNGWRRSYTAAAFAAAGAFLWWFIVHFGNRQFGGYDLSLLVDSAWRLASGQIPYRDFICTPPPGFYLGAGWAFRLFGVSWNALLYLTAIFSCASFVWIYALLSALVRSRAAAFLVSLAIEFAAVLLLGFWWHNSITSITGAVFLLSSLMYTRRPENRWAQLSYTASLALLGLMKPNIAGVLAAGGVVLVLIAAPGRRRTLLLTVAAAASTIAILEAQGISVTGMLASYRAAAESRGRFTAIGFEEMSGLDRARVVGCFLALAMPLGLCWGRLKRTIRERRLAAAAGEAIVLLAPLAALWGMFSNVDLKDVEWAPAIAVGAVLVFAPARRWRMERFYVAFLCMLAASDLYMGAMRYRIEGIGNHMFFDWTDRGRPAGTPFFRDLKGGPRFQAVLGQVGQVVAKSPGPVFFGPRMEFAYAAFGLPSPRHFPVWWHPGSSFALSDEARVLQGWRNNRFATLVFLKRDFTYYPPQFLRLIDALYVRDESYSELTLFHARGAAAPEVARSLSAMVLLDSR